MSSKLLWKNSFSSQLPENYSNYLKFAKNYIWPLVPCVVLGIYSSCVISIWYLCDLCMIFVWSLYDICVWSAWHQALLLSCSCDSLYIRLSFSRHQDLERDYQAKLDKLKQGERTRPLFCSVGRTLHVTSISIYRLDYL